MVQIDTTIVLRDNNKFTMFSNGMGSNFECIKINIDYVNLTSIDTGLAFL